MATQPSSGAPPSASSVDGSTGGPALESTGMMSDVCIPQSPVSPGPHVAVLIVFHANVEHTLSSIGSALRLDYPSLEVVAVDDGSVDGSASSVRAAYPSVRILRGDGTLWCNGGFNLGLRDCFRRGIDYVLLMNNDNVISSMALRFLMETERKHHPCVVGSVVADAAERQIVTYAGKTMNWRIGQAGVAYGRQGLVLGSSRDRSKPTQWASKAFSSRGRYSTAWGSSTIARSNTTSGIRTSTCARQRPDSRS